MMQSVKMNEGLFEKLRKIQALIADARDDHEAQVGMLLFQKLLDKNNLSAEDIELDPIEEAKVTELEILNGTRCFDWQKLLHMYIAHHFRCIAATRQQARWGKDHNIRYIKTFIGMGSDVEIAAATFRSAVEVCNKSWLRHLDRMKRETPWIRPNGGHKTQYCQAFADGLNAAYREQEARLCMDLILVRDPKVDEFVKGWKKNNYNMIRHDDAAGSRSHGYRDGLEYEHGRSLPETKK